MPINFVRVGGTLVVGLACILALFLSPSQSFAQTNIDPAQHAFDQAKELGTTAAWDAFLTSYPTGFLADLAKAYKQKLSEDDAKGDKPRPAELSPSQTSQSAPPTAVLDSKRPSASSSAQARLNDAIPALEKLLQDPGKLKIFCDMVKMSNAGSLVDMIKEAKERFNKRQVYFRKIGADFTKAWTLPSELETSDKATVDFDRFLIPYNRVVLTCPESWQAQLLGRAFNGVYQSRGRSLEVSYDPVFWDESREPAEHPDEPLHPGQEDIDFRLIHHSKGEEGNTEVAFRSDETPQDLRKKAQGARRIASNGPDIFAADILDETEKGINFYVPDLGMTIKARAPLQSFDEMAGHFERLVQGIRVGPNTTTMSDFEEAAGKYFVPPRPTSSAAIKAVDKWCDIKWMTVRGSISDDYDEKDQHGYKVENSEPCAVDYVVVPPTSGCGKGAMFSAVGVVKDALGDTAEDTRNIKAAAFSCAKPQ